MNVQNPDSQTTVVTGLLKLTRLHRIFEITP
jgi:hypothetical protein